MPILLDERDAKEIPAVPAKTADVMWIQTIVIRAPSPTSEASIALEFVPMTRDGELVCRDAEGNDTAKRLETPTLFADMQQIPELAAAFAAIMAAVKPFADFCASRPVSE